jgi:hypothetical protein
MTAICVVVFWVFMALRPAQAETSSENLTKALVRALSDGTTMKCGDLRITSSNGELKVTGPSGVFGPFTVKDDEIYLGGYRCVFLKCGASLSC